MKAKLKSRKTTGGEWRNRPHLKDMTQERGITLVALIITIIVLIILAAVTIFAFTESGLLKTASKGTENYASAQEYEKQIMDNITSLAGQVVANITGGSGNEGGTGTPPDPVEPTANWDLTKVNKVTSEDGAVVPVPKGFTMSSVAGEKSVSTGLVIKQDGTANEFVWVPVANPSEMFTTDPDGNPVGQLYDFGKYDSTEDKFVANNPPTKITYSSTGYREPDYLTDTTNGDASTQEGKGIEQLKNVIGITGSSNDEVLANWKTQLQNEFNQMKVSIETYKGFYIGRYETGDLSKAKASVSKNNSDINNQNWYTMYQKSKGIVDGKSSMIWGCQWDATLRWFLSSEDTDTRTYVTNSTGKGNYSGRRIPTGSENNYSVNNIYDMAGNVVDWTIEANKTDCRVLRRS